MADGKVALGIAPNAAPPRPIAIGPTIGIAAPIVGYAAIFDFEIVDVAPDGAG